MPGSIEFNALSWSLTLLCFDRALVARTLHSTDQIGLAMCEPEPHMCGLHFCIAVDK